EMPSHNGKPKKAKTKRKNHEFIDSAKTKLRITSPYCYRGRACRGLRWGRTLRAAAHGRLPMGAGADHDRWGRRSIKYNTDGPALVWIDNRSTQWGHLRL